MAPNLQLTYLDRVLLEIIETERMYVRDLRMIVEDYLAHIIDQCDLLLGPEQVCALFGNIEDIYEFNSELLQALDSCANDAVAVARCFVTKGHFFDIYSQYCTNYPSSVVALTECLSNKRLAAFFRERQASLKSSLPLGSYLLKPVQRILKYHLLLQEIAKHFDPDEQGYEVVEEAIYTMTGVAWYINDMKRKHEHAIRLQEVQSLLLSWKGPDLTTYGELVLEGTFKVHRARSERTLFLFERVLLITKRRGEHFVYKTHICCSTLMLIESAKDSLSFSVTHYKHPKQPLTVQAKTVEERKLWAHHIKRIILENHQAIIPQKAKDAIMETRPSYAPRYRQSPDRTRTAASCPSEAQQDAGQERPPSGTPAAPVLQTPPPVGRLCAAAGTQDPGGRVPSPGGRVLSPGGRVPSPGGPLSEDGTKKPNGPEATCDPTEELLLLQEATEEPAEEPAELEPSEVLGTRPDVSESPQRSVDQPCDGAESREKVSPTVLSSEESSEEEEEAVVDGVAGGHSPRLLPSSVLDRAGAIAQHFSTSVRRPSLAQEDVGLLGSSSPRPHGPASSLRSQAVESTVTEPSGEDSFWNLDGDPGWRRDSTLSKQDQLLIGKIKRYYENAGGQSPTSGSSGSSRLQRRESLSSIPAGLVRSSVSRINSVETTSWVAPAAPSAAPATEDQAVPDHSGESQRSQHGSAEDGPSEEEEFLPSSQMIRIWQEMEQKIALAQEEKKIPRLPEAPQSFKVPDSRKVQNKDRPPDSQDRQRAKVCEEELFVLRAPGHQGAQTKPEAGEEHTSKVLHLARQYSQKIKTSRPVVRQRSQGLLMSKQTLACVMEELEKTESPRNQAGPLSHSAEDRPAKDHPTEDRPAKDRPTKDHPTEDRPAKDRPTKDHPTEDRPAKDRPAKDRPTKDHPTEDRPAKDHPTKDRPTEDRPAKDHPTKDRPTKDRPAKDHPTKDRPAEDRPTKDRPTEDRPSEDRPAEDRPTSRLPCKEEMISTDQVQTGSKVQSSPTEAFDWPDVQRLRSKFSSGGGGQRRALSRARSMPERLLVRRHSSCSCVVLPDGPCFKAPSPESGDSWDGVTEEWRRRLQRAAPLDLQLRSRTLAGAPQQLLRSAGYFVAAETPRPDDPEHSVIVMEKVQDAMDTAEEEGEDNYVQIRSPTSKEKISLMAVVDRCRVYQDPDQSREEAKVLPGGVRAPDQESQRSEARQESSKQGRVRNLREKFQNMS